ncbi:protein-glutamate O-methyltransferase [Halioxenophilus sp. WMMB6]|uniref:CheR family methyltransferase n=1 Tax=Halioxenophilus sp. WMMB6 TaxID=3073815 RepID=UPI00295F3A97|nr:protein-glutamate O-methyltransferase [Halioxenophilus sp. WMMB6]
MSAPRAEQYSLNAKQFKTLCTMVYDMTGIVLADSKQEMVYRRLMRRIRELKIASFSLYFDLLQSNESDELRHFVNAITTNLTSFFRECHHFDYLKESFLPSHLTSQGANSRLRIWSTACSTGEEPYSIAITLADFFGGKLSGWDAKILATDIDTNVLAKAKAGVYSADRVGNIEPEIVRRWFLKSKNKSTTEVKVSTALQSLITFKPLNLIGTWPMCGPFDVIFCRNVLIYFDKTTQQALLHRFVEMLRPGGVLMLGHSESVAKGYEQLLAVGKTTFIKRTEAALAHAR